MRIRLGYAHFSQKPIFSKFTRKSDESRFQNRPKVNFMIILDNINLKFNETIVLENFSEQFAQGKINCILGPSGCGKTSLLNLLSTQFPRVSYVFQEDALIPQKTARQNLEIVLKSVYSKVDLNTTISKFLNLVELETAANLYPHEMSGGMRQRLALARAFAYPSDILLMDEPFKALDISLKNNIIKSFLNLYKQDEKTTIFVTHDIDEALLTGDFIHVYSHKPLTLQKKFSLQSDKLSRKIYDDEISQVKNDIYKETEKWAHLGLTT